MQVDDKLAKEKQEKEIRKFFNAQGNQKDKRLASFQPRLCDDVAAKLTATEQGRKTATFLAIKIRALPDQKD